MNLLLRVVCDFEDDVANFDVGAELRTQISGEYMTRVGGSNFKRRQLFVPFVELPLFFDLVPMFNLLSYPMELLNNLFGFSLKVLLSISM